MPNLTLDFQNGNMAALLNANIFFNMTGTALGTLPGVVHNTLALNRVYTAQYNDCHWTGSNYSDPATLLRYQKVANSQDFDANRVTATINDLYGCPAFISSGQLSGCTVCCLLITDAGGKNKIRMIHIGADADRPLPYPVGDAANKLQHHLWRITHDAVDADQTLDQHCKRILDDPEVRGGVLVHSLIDGLVPDLSTYTHPVHHTSLRRLRYNPIMYQRGACHSLIYNDGSNRRAIIGAASYTHDFAAGVYNIDSGTVFFI